MRVQAIGAVLSVNSQLPVPDALFPVEGRSRLPDPAHVLVPIPDLRVRVFFAFSAHQFFLLRAMVKIQVAALARVGSNRCALCQTVAITS